MSFLHLSDHDWIWLATLCYLAGFALGTFRLVRGCWRSQSLIYVLLAAGIALQTTGLYLRGISVKGCPVGNGFELLQFVAWSLVVIFLTVGPAFRMSLLGWLCGSLAALLCLSAELVPGLDASRDPRLFGDTPWIAFHASIALFSYGVFALLALTALMHLLQSRLLHVRHTTGLSRLLPSIADLEQVNYRLLLAGALLLTLAMGVGAVHWLREAAQVDAAKIAATGAVWLCAAALVALRWSGRLYARRLAWACLALFLGALLSLGPVNASRHPQPAPPAAREAPAP